MSLLPELKKEKILAIMRGLTRIEADRTAEALFMGGIRFMEVTMNTDGAADMIASWRKSYDKQAYIGAGTVIDLEQAKQAVAAGAQFIVSPNLDMEVIQYGLSQGVDVWPGTMTPTEIVQAWKAGAEAVKVFPMASLGIDYFREIRAPLDQIPMIITGGVNRHNIQSFIQAGAAAVGMGSHLADKQLIKEGKFDQITEHARQLIELSRS